MPLLFGKPAVKFARPMHGEQEQGRSAPEQEQGRSAPEQEHEQESGARADKVKDRPALSASCSCSCSCSSFLPVLVLLLLLLLGPGCASLPAPPPARTALERRGRHVLRIATGCGCHGANFAGWRPGRPDLLPEAAPYGERFAGPFGEVPARNITPDAQTGIGAWSDAQITRALREGITPDGQRLDPIMPYHAYHGMAQSDLAALIAYLHRLRPVHNPVPARQLAGPVPEPGPLPPAPARPPAGGIALGRYLVQNVCTCTDCHLPPGAAGPDQLTGQLLPAGPGRTVRVPNITPDPETGIGRWSEAEIARYLRAGSRPDGGLAQSLMAGVILTSYSHLTRDEARAMAAYLKSLPPSGGSPAVRRNSQGGDQARE